MVGYSQAKYILNKESTSSFSGQITYPETQDEHIYHATTINLLLSKKIAFFTPLIGGGIILTQVNLATILQLLF